MTEPYEKPALTNLQQSVVSYDLEQQQPMIWALNVRRMLKIQWLRVELGDAKPVVIVNAYVAAELVVNAEPAAKFAEGCAVLWPTAAPGTIIRVVVANAKHVAIGGIELIGG